MKKNETYAKRRLLNSILETSHYIAKIPFIVKFHCGYSKSCLFIRMFYSIPSMELCLFDFKIFSSVSRRYSRIQSLVHEDTNSLKKMWSTKMLNGTKANIWNLLTDIDSPVFDIVENDGYPEKISLGFGDCFHMNITIWIKDGQSNFFLL